ncbi:MAG TPA: hypothetical protein VMZ33_03245 [Candidatus Limnocylindrales bacterium]|nr:hypothetical protein [Candidatus Limnocylindrales bacterium]
MAIYRPRRSRWPLLLAVGVICFLLGGAVGAVVVGSRSADLEETATIISDEMGASAGLLEVVEIEYTEAVAPGGGEIEYEAALDNLSRSRERYDSVANGLAVLDPDRARRIETGFARLQTMIAERAEAAAVGDGVASLREELL